MKKYILIFAILFIAVSYRNSNAQYKGGSYDGYYSKADTGIPYPVGIENITEVAVDYKLYQNYPNPFNPQTIIKFDVVKNSSIKIIIYDISGKKIDILVNQVMN
ncbi:MAG: hypothetical protein LH629_04915, partial [Ignavibacteria bacterium]|nr:hypothetical protein [Ignavibacteria bacterium]